MEYVFGRNESGLEILKTIGEKHTEFKDDVTVVREYSDNHFTDSFTIVEKYKSAENAEGVCYDWYVIKDHYRYGDKFTPNIPKYEQMITDLEIAQIENEQISTDHEIAILELQLR